MSKNPKEPKEETNSLGGEGSSISRMAKMRGQEGVEYSENEYCLRIVSEVPDSKSPYLNRRSNLVSEGSKIPLNDGLELEVKDV